MRAVVAAAPVGAAGAVDECRGQDQGERDTGRESSGSRLLIDSLDRGAAAGLNRGAASACLMRVR